MKEKHKILVGEIEILRVEVSNKDRELAVCTSFMLHVIIHSLALYHMLNAYRLVEKTTR